MTEVRSNPKHRELIPQLQKLQDENGYISKEGMVKIANSLNISLSDVYSTATFYSFFIHKPVGKNIIRVCKSLPCYLKDSQGLIERLKDILGISPGETTADNKFSLLLTNCIGDCDQAPAMMINDTIYGNLSDEKKIEQVLAEYK